MHKMKYQESFKNKSLTFGQKGKLLRAFATLVQHYAEIDKCTFWEFKMNFFNLRNQRQ